MTAESGLAELIRAVPALANADPAVVEQLEVIAREIEAPEGTLIFNEGDQQSDLFFVASGSFALDMVTHYCGKQQILTVGDGDLLAWSSFLSGGRMTASAVALEPSRLLAFDADQLRQLCEANHEVGYVVMSAIAKLISRRLLATRLQLLDLFHS